MWYIQVEMVEGQRHFVYTSRGMALKIIGAIASTVLGRKELTKGTTLTVMNGTVSLFCFSLFMPLVTVFLRRLSLSVSGTTLTWSIASELAKNEISSNMLTSYRQLREIYTRYQLLI